MKTEDLSTLKINKLTQKQFDKALQEGRINENELYLTPDNIGVNGLPENAEFTNVTVNGGNLVFSDYENSIQFNGSGAKIYDNKANDELVFDVPTGVLILKSGDEEKQIATLDDIGSSGGSALDENGNLVIDDYNKGIVFSAYDTEPAIYLDGNDDRLAFSMQTKFKDGLFVGNEDEASVFLYHNYISRWVNENGDEYTYNFPNESGTLAVVSNTGDMNLSGNLSIQSDEGNVITNAPSTNDIDATFYAQGIQIEDCDTGETNYLYFPQKTGTLVVADEYGNINIDYDQNENIGTIIRKNGMYTCDGRVSIDIGASNNGVYIYDNDEDKETTYKAGVIDNYGSMLTLPNKSGTLATLEDLGDINAILDILNGEVV